MHASKKSGKIMKISGSVRLTKCTNFITTHNYAHLEDDAVISSNCRRERVDHLRVHFQPSSVSSTYE